MVWSAIILLVLIGVAIVVRWAAQLVPILMELVHGRQERNEGDDQRAPNISCDHLGD